MTKYEMLMNRIEVTPEMRERILRNLAGRKNVSGFRRYRVTLIAAAAMILILAVFLPRLNQPSSDSTTVSAPEVQEFSSPADLESAAGWKIAANFTLPFEPASTVYRLIDSDVAEIDFTGADGTEAVYRTSATMADPSGEYGPFASDTAWGRIRLRGYETDQYSLANWTEDGVYSSLSFSAGYALEDWKLILPD